MEKPEPEDQEELTAEQVKLANEARIAYLRSHGISVPMDQMYVTSLLEFILGGTGHLDAARDYHERRVAPMLDQAIANLAKIESQQQSKQARSILLNGVTGA